MALDQQLPTINETINNINSSYLYEGDFHNPDDEKYLNELLIETLFGSTNGSASNPIVKEEATLPYLQRLVTQSFDTIATEPDRLGLERQIIEKDMEELAFSQFGAFISNASCLEDVKGDIDRLADCALSISDKLPHFTAACQEFCRRVHGISKSRKLNHKTLKQHSNLLDILELPVLMDTCVRNQHYEEALEIQHHALRLANQHQAIPVIKNVADEIKASTSSMQIQLHQLLCGNINLPTCLRLIGYLRRLGTYSEKELRITFLQCRSTYLHESLSLIPTNNHYIYLSKVIDTTRSQISEIINQYRAIFEQDDDLPSALKSKQMNKEDFGSVLQGWVFYQIGDFLKILEVKLPLVSDGTGISNLLSQCMYFGLSMGRMQADFRGLLTPIFEKSIMQLVNTQFNDVTEVFAVQLKKYRPVLGLASPTTNKSTPSKTNTTNTPPMILLEYMPLAHLANGIIGTFNELRKCCPYSLQNAIVLAFEDMLYIALDKLNTFRSQMEGDSEQDKKAFLNLCKVTANELLPYLLNSFDLLWKSPKKLVSYEKLIDRMNQLGFLEAEVQNVDQLLASLETESVTK